MLDKFKIKEDDGVTIIPKSIRTILGNEVAGLMVDDNPSLLVLVKKSNDTDKVIDELKQIGEIVKQLDNVNLKKFFYLE